MGIEIENGICQIKGGIRGTQKLEVVYDRATAAHPCPRKSNACPAPSEDTRPGVEIETRMTVTFTVGIPSPPLAMMTTTMIATAVR